MSTDTTPPTPAPDPAAELAYEAFTPEQNEYLRAAAREPVRYHNGTPFQIREYQSTAELWRHCPPLVRFTRQTADGQAGKTFACNERAGSESMLRDWQNRPERAAEMLAAGAATDSQKARLEAALERVDVGQVIGACEAHTRRPVYRHFEDADEPCIDRVVAGHEVWTAGIRRGRLAPVVKLGFNTLVRVAYRTENSYLSCAVIAYLASTAAAALGWDLEIWYVNTGHEHFATGFGQLGIACKLCGPDRPLDPEVFAAHSGSAGHLWAAWVNNCAQHERYRREGWAYTSSRGLPRLGAVAARQALGFDYLLSTNMQGESAEEMTAGILRSGMDAALARLNTPRDPAEVERDLQDHRARFAGQLSTQD